MDPSALIFAALAVAWAAYLIPKALQQHEESIRSRTVERFSQGMRVIARREPVGLVTTRRAPAAAAPAPAPPQVRRRTPASPAKRRRRVLGLVLLANLVVVVLAATSLIGWAWVTATVALLLAWLAACRMMVTQERRPAARPAERPAARPRTPAPEQLAEATVVVAEHAVPVPQLDPADVTEEQAAVPAAADGTWDPQDVPLPTYVSKPAAPRRSVRTIDLDSTGVWTSGRRESDSQLVREQEREVEAAKALADAKAARDQAKRQSG